MVAQELATSVAEDIPVTVVVLNNGWLGMVRQWQKLFWDKRYSGTDLRPDPDFVKLAESYGCRGIKVERSEDISDALRQAMDSDRTCLVDIHTDPEEDITPMILSNPDVPIVRGRCPYRGFRNSMRRSVPVPSTEHSMPLPDIMSRSISALGMFLPRKDSSGTRKRPYAPPARFRYAECIVSAIYPNQCARYSVYTSSSNTGTASSGP